MKEGITMDYIEKNKKAWEQAYENRSDDFDSDIIERLKTEEFPYLDPELLFELREYELKGKSCAQFSSNNGRELLNLYKAGLEKGTGFDIATNMVAAANGFAKELGYDCNFVEANILEIGDEYREQFDYGLITIGALTWLQDVGAYFKVVAKCLKPGGVLFIHEMHPMANMFALNGEDNFDPENPKGLANSYFKDEPWVANDGMNYMTKKEYSSETFTSFAHSMGEIVSAMGDNGLLTIKLREYDRDITTAFGALEGQGIPLSMVIVAKKLG
ncbi:MAG TPA: class I SAM-dependent methyltransferase [Clostridiaceae bacterium]|nr:class I SAM-dependent methyltransferase [Clostridiaceae bacterium]